MAKNFNLLPNEVVILREENAFHGDRRAVNAELILTNLNIICIEKGVFGKPKGTLTFPLSEIKLYNGKPHAIMGKFANTIPTLEVYFVNGQCETFRFIRGKKRTINNWINEINKIIIPPPDEEDYSGIGFDYNPSSVVGTFMEVGEHFKDIGSDMLDNLGFDFSFKKPKKKEPSNTPERISKKCLSCSAPLVGYKGKIVKCKYCDTEQTL